MYRESDYDIPLTNDVPALADSEYFMPHLFREH